MLEFLSASPSEYEVAPCRPWMWKLLLEEVDQSPKQGLRGLCYNERGFQGRLRPGVGGSVWLGFAGPPWEVGRDLIFEGKSENL